MNSNKPFRRLVATALSVFMVLMLIPVSVSTAAEMPPVGVNGEIVSFEELVPEIAVQRVPTGTGETALVLPEMLTASVQSETVPAETEYGSGEVGTPGPAVLELMVTWRSAPEYDGNTAGNYIFTPVLPERYTLAEGLEPPQISVTVEEPSQISAMPEDLMFSAMAAETADYSWYDANTAASQFTISSSAQLKGLADIVNGDHGTAFGFSGRVVNLISDLDLSDYENWTPIGANYKTFDGTFKGNGHTISGLTINDQAQSYVGLFGMMLGSVSDLYLSNINITGYQYVGGIAGEAWGSINRCAAIGGTVNGNAYVGGIAGKVAYNGSLLTSCFTTCDVRAIGFSPYSAGGVAGRVEYGGSLTSCYAIGSVKTGAGFSGYFDGAGGVVGSVNGGTVRGCFSTGEIAGTIGIGGIAGALSTGYGATTVENCAALNIRVAGDAGAYGGPSTGRVAGRVSGSPQVTNAIAFSGMIVVAAGGSNINGTDKSSTDIKGAGFFEANGFPAPAWQSETGMLPILTGFPGGMQSSELPAHIGSPTPTQPQTLTAVPNNGSVKLDWAAPGSAGASSITRYEVRKNTDAWISTGMTMTYTFSGLTNGTVYTFEVRAVNSYGNGASASIQRIPVSPGNMAAIPGDQNVILNWATPPAVIGSIQLYQVRYNEGTWRTPDTNYFHTFFGLVNGESYTFDIQGLGMNGSTPGVLFSASAVAMPVGKPLAPTNLTAVSGNQQVALSWNAPFSDGGSPILRYEVSKDDGANWIPVGTATTYTFTGLINATTYSLKVRAVNAVGTGNAETVSATPRQPPVITSTSSQSITYGSGGSFTISASGMPPFTYALSGQPSGISINGTTGQVTIEKTVPAAAHTFTITVSNGSMPNAVQNFTLNISRRTPQLSDLQYTAPSDRTYTGTGSGIGPVTDKNAIGLSCTVYYQGIDGTIYTKSVTPPKNVGRYEAIASIASNTNINAVELSLGTYRILPRSITVTPNAGQNKVYGQLDPLLQYTLSNTLSTGDTLTGALARNAGENVGTYSITMGTLTAGSNYTLSLSGTVTFTINPKADAAFTIAAISPLTYTGSALTPEPQVKDGSMLLTKNVHFTYSYSNNINAGTSAAVTITGIGNYAGSTGSTTFTINKATPSLILTANPSTTQMRPGSVLLCATLPDDATGTLIFRAGAAVIGEPITLLDNTAVFMPTTENNNYSFIVEYSGDSNYNGKSSEELEYSFTKSEQAPLDTADGMVSFGDTLDLSALVSGGSGTGTFSFAVTDGPAVLDGATLTPTGAGEVNILATKAADNDFNAKSASLKVTVNPREITFTVDPVGMQTYTGIAITPTPEVKDGDVILTEGLHFTYSYNNNIDAGYSAVVNIVGIDGYTGSTGSAIFTIGGAAPSITTPPAVNGTVYAGIALTNIELTGGEASVSGHFEWVNPTAAAISGQNTFEVRFVPDDTVIYIRVEGIGITFSAISRPSSGSILSTPTYKAEIKSENGTETTLMVTVNKDSGTVSVDVSSLSNAIGGTIITIPTIPDADTYSVVIPVAELSTAGEQGMLTVNNDTGSITIPSNMLTSVSGANGSKAEITIGQGDKSTLPDKVKSAIGNRPLVQLMLSIDGKQTNWSNPAAPVTVSIPYTPTAAELVNPEGIIVWYIDGGGNIVTMPNGRYNPATGMVTFNTTHFSDYAVTYSRVRFKDVAAGAWYKKAVSFIAARNITSGTGNGYFSPDAKLTRGEFIVLMMRAYGIMPDTNPTDNFSDADSTYYTGYLAAAKRLGITAGVGNNLFAPGKEITRQEMFTLLYNALKVIKQLPQGNSGKTVSDFTDASKIEKWAREAMRSFVVTGTVGGNAGKLMPNGTTTRAEMTQVLYNLLGKQN